MAALTPPSPNPPLLSAFAPKTPPLPGSSEDENDEDDEDDDFNDVEKMSLDGDDKNEINNENENENDEEEEEEEEEVNRRAEARRALSPGHPFSYPSSMLRYLYSRSVRGSKRALEQSVAKARARRGGV